MAIKRIIKEISNDEYMKIYRMSKEQILSGIQYKIHGCTLKMDKYELTNCYLESRHGEFIVTKNKKSN
jgi:hypothetical protein